MLVRATLPIEGLVWLCCTFLLVLGVVRVGSYGSMWAGQCWLVLGRVELVE